MPGTDALNVLPAAAVLPSNWDAAVAHSGVEAVAAAAAAGPTLCRSCGCCKHCNNWRDIIAARSDCSACETESVVGAECRFVAGTVCC